MIKSAAVVKTDSAENWAKAKNYIPDPGTIIIYELSNNNRKVKIGDGKTLVEQLPFLSTFPPVVEDDVLDLRGGI